MTVLQLYIDYPWAAAFIAFALGAMVGSFLNVVVSRYPLHQQWELRREARSILSVPDPLPDPEPPTLSSPSSQCPSCKTPIRPRDNIPILSWMLLRGRCRSCAAPISPRYLIIEVASGLLCAAPILFLAVTAEAVALSVATLFLLAISAVDQTTRTIPDQLSFALIAIGLLTPLVQSLDPAPQIIGMCLGYAACAGIAAIYHLKTGNDGLGEGDAKLLAAAGALLGWQALLPTLFLAAISMTAYAALTRRSAKDEVAFGPFIAIAIYLGGYGVWQPLISEFVRLL